MKTKGVSSREVMRMLRSVGWVEHNSERSHVVFRHPQRAGHISLPHPKKDPGEGLVRKIYRQAGLLR